MNNLVGLLPLSDKKISKATAGFDKKISITAV